MLFYDLISLFLRFKCFPVRGKFCGYNGNSRGEDFQEREYFRGISLVVSQPNSRSPPENVLQCPGCIHPEFLKRQRSLNIQLDKSHKLYFTNLSNTRQSPPPLSPTPLSSVVERGSTNLSEHKRAFPVVKRLPRCARFTVATSFSKAIDDCASEKYSWENLLLFAFNILHVSKKDHHRSLTAKIKFKLFSLNKYCFLKRQSIPRDIFKVVEAK